MSNFQIQSLLLLSGACLVGWVIGWLVRKIRLYNTTKSQISAQ